LTAVTAYGRLTIRLSCSNRMNIWQPVEDIWYTVALTDGVKKLNGDKAFTDACKASAIPGRLKPAPISISRLRRWKRHPAAADDGAAQRGRPDQFQRSGRSTTVTGAATTTPGGFEFISIKDQTGATTTGNYYISNMYRTVEFLTENACGHNSCGDIIYCLPADSAFSALIKAARIVEPISTTSSAVFLTTASWIWPTILWTATRTDCQGPKEQSGFPAYVEPVSGGTNADAAQQGDDYTWSFNTTIRSISALPPSTILYRTWMRSRRWE